MQNGMISESNGLPEGFIMVFRRMQNGMISERGVRKNHKTGSRRAGAGMEPAVEMK